MPANWTPSITIVVDRTPWPSRASAWARSLWRAIRAGMAAGAERRRQLREERRALELLAAINRRVR